MSSVLEVQSQQRKLSGITFKGSPFYSAVKIGYFKSIRYSTKTKELSGYCSALPELVGG